MGIVLDRLWVWFWHLLPANPILVRVVHGASRRVRHLWLRFVYLSVLLLVVLLSLVMSMSGQSASLAELAKAASQTFKWASMTQLALMCFLAPVFTASAITQERDAQTFNILLSTPLSSAQIVFGSLMSRLYFVIMLLVAGLPIFLITMVYGGVTASQIFKSFAISGTTAILTGALAIFVAMTAVGTRRTIFSFYLLIALYLLSVYLFGVWNRTWIEAAPGNVMGQKMSWLAPLHPFLALDVALNRVPAPPLSRLMDRSGIVRYALAYPWAFYVIWTSVLALVLTLASIFYVRRGIKTGEPTIVSRLRERLTFRRGERLTRPPRNVWSNPVAWREAKTRISTGGLFRWMTILAGLIVSLALFMYHVRGDLSAGEVPQWLAGLTIIQFGIVLLIATNTAATSMTKEKESQTMDLLLCTPVTSKYILWGKLRGLVQFAAPLLAVPVLTLIAFGIYGLMKGDNPPAVWLETGILLGALLIVYTGLACVLGLRVSLTSRTNVTAVMYSIGLLIVLTGVLTAAGLAFVEASRGEFGAFVAPFTPFTLIRYLVDPSTLFTTRQEFVTGAHSTRAAGLSGCLAALVLYAVIVWRSYAFLVRDFDMTMRKQSGL
jgi:ABC-type transport system involved in multi-copper enzyme maturation permease subunit